MRFGIFVQATDAIEQGTAKSLLGSRLHAFQPSNEGAATG
jgi:hypothetical protein